jgi:hypothetical protein
MEHHKSEFNRAAVSPAEIEFDSREESTPLEGGFVDSRTKANISIAPNPPAAEKTSLIEDQLIYDDALKIAADFLYASEGQDIQPEHYLNLLVNGWRGFDIDEVYRVFQDEWSNLQADARQLYKERRAQSNRGRRTQGWQTHLAQLLKASTQIQEIKPEEAAEENQPSGEIDLKQVAEEIKTEEIQPTEVMYQIVDALKPTWPQFRKILISKGSTSVDDLISYFDVYGVRITKEKIVTTAKKLGIIEVTQHLEHGKETRRRQEEPARYAL